MVVTVEAGGRRSACHYDGRSPDGLEKLRRFLAEAEKVGPAFTAEHLRSVLRELMRSGVSYGAIAAEVRDALAESVIDA